MDLNQILTDTMKSLGYSDKLTAKAMEDLEKVIATRYYNRIVALLPPTTTKDVKANDYQAIIEIARQSLDQSTLQDSLLVITKDTVNEYIDLIINK